jgi:hypothetical protein
MPDSETRTAERPACCSHGDAAAAILALRGEGTGSLYP